MGLMKRYTRAALLFLGMTLAGHSSVLAQQIPIPYDGMTLTLFPVAEGINAAGTAHLSSVTFDGWSYFNYDEPVWVEEYTGYLTITCSGLKPRTNYNTRLGVMKTDVRGNGTISGWTTFGFGWWVENDSEHDPRGQVFQVNVSDKSRKTLLSGEIAWQQYEHCPAWP